MSGAVNMATGGAEDDDVNCRTSFTADDGRRCPSPGMREPFSLHLLWPPYGIGQAIVLSSCGSSSSSSSFFFFFSSPNLSGRRLDVYHTSTHGVSLV